MSKLLIQSSGRPSSTVKHGAGGLELAPGARITGGGHDVLGGVQVIPVSSAAGTADNDVCALYFLGSSTHMYRENNGGQTAATTALVGANGLELQGDDATDGYIYSPYFSNGTIQAQTRVSENCFEVGQDVFRFRLNFQSSSIALGEIADFFVGFSELPAAAWPVTNVADDLVSAYGMKIGADQDDVAGGGAMDIQEQSSTASTATFTDTTVNLAAATDTIVEIIVNKSGVCSMTIDGVDVTTATGKTFTSGTLITPVIYFDGSGNTEKITCKELRYGGDLVKR